MVVNTISELKKMISKIPLFEDLNKDILQIVGSDNIRYENLREIIYFVHDFQPDVILSMPVKIQQNVYSFMKRLISQLQQVVSFNPFGV